MKLSLFFLFVFLLSLFLLPVAVAKVDLYQQFVSADIVETITLDGHHDDSIIANITITDPDNIVIVSFDPMNYDSVGKIFNYTLNQTSKTGVYERCVYATAPGVGANETLCKEFKVTPSGKEQTSILDNSVLILFVLLGLALLGLGIHLENPWFGFLGAIMFLLGGVYTIIYGFNNEQTFYTQGVGITTIGLGFIFMILSVYEFVWGARHDE